MTRLIQLVRVFTLTFTADRLDGGYIVTIADQLEMTIAIIAASLPALGAILVTVWNDGAIALVTWWDAAHSYFGMTGRSRSFPTVTSAVPPGIPPGVHVGIELKPNKKTMKQLTENSTDSDTNTLSLPVQQNATSHSSHTRSGRWKPWGNRNILNFTTRDDSQVQSTVTSTVDQDDDWPLGPGEVMGISPLGNRAGNKGTNFMDQSFDLVIQKNDTKPDSWVDVERGYSRKR
jgi:hypothetical protein